MHKMAVLVGALLLGSTASATTVRGFTPRQMTLEAATVVRGTVTERQSRWNADRTRIYTDSTITVREVLTGARGVGKTITVRQIGGTVGDTSMHVEGVAPIVRGEEVLLFLRTDGRHYFTVGMAQGKYRIARAKDGTEVVTRELEGLQRVDKGGLLHASPRVLVAPKRYADFATEIRAWAREAREEAR